jgi:ABC-2 type transport system permease protein
MKFSRIYSIFLRQVFLIKSNPVRLISIFLWTIIDIVQWGFITKYLGSFGGAVFNVVTVLLGSIILWEFMGRIQQGMMTSFLEDIWTQNFINFFASPLEVKEYLLGLILTSIITGSIGFSIMVLIAGLIFGYSIFIIGLYILPFIFILFIFGVAMGLFITGLIFRLGPSAEWLGWPIPLVMSIFVGVFYPISILPEYLQVFSNILPPTYVFESIRAVISGNFNIGTNLVWGFGLAIIYLFLTYLFFLRVYRHNLKTGAISRFNAESA